MKLFYSIYKKVSISFHIFTNFFTFYHKMFMNLDIDFIEFYIKKKYSQKLEEYFDVNKSVASKWRNSNFPERRLNEFIWREGSSDILELFKRIY